ncbi:MAG: tRNA 5-methoxyuridine(34)/uridine 5-oxyacetic acid(34) synthase CmoB [Pseudomonadales bacterium]|nr:tRNA 5-methoxyuridine(34)/uridine 5-oxyacetic acid(34) synthase CmoB [Pseudomonadales bacterium]NRA16147.1 tRNA 5-methoxyuridine(34)/uridine 5-oxyacetic acid(34) synthase CmoB [Oceanospirillaceae bacterium]
MINYKKLIEDFSDTDLAACAEFWPRAVEKKMLGFTHGYLQQWQQLMADLPQLHSAELELKSDVRVGTEQELAQQLTAEQIADFIAQLKTLSPWRKGPFSLYGIHIDTEWRSNWKWDRLLTHISPLQDRTIIDVGCGNGYHCWRMLGEGAKAVLGIDPTQKFLAQFGVIKKYLGEQLPVHLLPLGIEDMPKLAESEGVDSVFSMGVLYHRKSPIDHLLELKALLKPGGELVLETIVIDGDEQTVLVPQGRYAQMRNIWFLPSAPALASWLRKCGFKNVRIVDVAQTTLDEQRATPWMDFHSLTDFLDPQDKSKTLEGHPAPKRAIIIAQL